MGRLGPLGAREKRGDTAVDLARSIEPGRATTESANHLRIPDLRKDQAEETIKASAAGSPAAVRASIVRNERLGQLDQTRFRSGRPRAPASPNENQSIRGIAENVTWIVVRAATPRNWTAEMNIRRPVHSVLSRRGRNFQFHREKRATGR